MERIRNLTVHRCGKGEITDVEVTFGFGFVVRIAHFEGGVAMFFGDPEIAVEFAGDQNVMRALSTLTRTFPDNVMESNPFGITLPVHRRSAAERAEHAAQREAERNAELRALPSPPPAEPVSADEHCRHPVEQHRTMMDLTVRLGGVTLHGEHFDAVACDTCGACWLQTTRLHGHDDEEGLIFWLRIDDPQVEAQVRAGDLSGVEQALPALMWHNSEGETGVGLPPAK
ncbi:MAG: hypothetical protein ACOZNI_27055 [Myxococcota bacterium]